MRSINSGGRYGQSATVSDIEGTRLEMQVVFEARVEPSYVRSHASGATYCAPYGCGSEW